ncbi:hypothetical protein F511_47111 [Dorcoceras hygrometricum]|uniref:Uncharacterized protein n=1 Tax=Dorcoceras hygrometricum TaxID=472368 RepID=A0A2Z6ZRW4_9LAMI|nr:hypothetical protein F511_47111 [Dorcoceras hygrometricum]
MAKATVACKEKDASTVLVSVLYRGALHQNGKKTRQPSGALKSFWKLSNGKNFSRGYILEATPIEEVSPLYIVNETLCVRSVGATTILWEIFIDYTVHQQRENNLK